MFFAQQEEHLPLSEGMYTAVKNIGVITIPEGSRVGRCGVGAVS